MFGNLIRESGCLESLSQTAQGPLANLITIFLGITIAYQMRAEVFVTGGTLLVMALGLFDLHLRHDRRRALCKAAEPLPAQG